MLSPHQFSLNHWSVLRLFGKYGKPKADPDGKMLEPTIAGQLQKIEILTEEKQKKAESATLLAQLRELEALQQELAKMAEMARAMKDALPQASAKTRDGFAILQRMIDDTRDLYHEAVPSQTELANAMEKLGADKPPAPKPHPAGPRLIQKLGTVDCDMVETTPIVVRSRLYRVEYVRERYPHKAPGENGSYFRLLDVATGEPTSPFARGFHLCSAYVEGDAVYVFGVEKWGANKVQGFRSSDLKTWESFPALDLPGWSIFNNSVCKGDERYVMAIEIDAPPEETGTPFTIRFAESQDLRNWKLSPPSCVFAKNRYTACPTLRFQDDQYYMIYLEALPGPEYLSYIVRSTNLINWESSSLNPVLKHSSADHNIASTAKNLSPTERERIANAANLNNSDIDL